MVKSPSPIFLSRPLFSSPSIGVLSFGSLTNSPLNQDTPSFRFALSRFLETELPRIDIVLPLPLISLLIAVYLTGARRVGGRLKRAVRIGVSV
ncbi:MAG: hypothetical protein HYU39_08720 [Thaumarchaeota archaeon]|nr:hypothetical protein [Nitrososphaerota archaeon]